jgi:hypothetical protein
MQETILKNGRQYRSHPVYAVWQCGTGLLCAPESLIVSLKDLTSIMYLYGVSTEISCPLKREEQIQHKCALYSTFLTFPLGLRQLDCPTEVAIIVNEVRNDSCGQHTISVNVAYLVSFSPTSPFSLLGVFHNLLAPPVVTVTVLFIFTIQPVVVIQAETASLQQSPDTSRWHGWQSSKKRGTMSRTKKI